MLAAQFQDQHPNRCKYARDGMNGSFGSKFVTVVVTGDSNNQIHFEGYQVSNQCIALVKDECLIPTFDAPELGYIKESSNEQYVPDVFYKYKDSFGNEVSSLARPLPVEYLLLDMPAAFPLKPIYTLHASKSPFPVANRESLGIGQDLNSLIRYLKNYSNEEFLMALSDIHVLHFFAIAESLPLSKLLDELCSIIKTGDLEKFEKLKNSDEWKTVETLMETHGNSSMNSRQQTFVGSNAQPLPPIRSSSTDQDQDQWSCQHCTLINQITNENCEMCGLPKQ